MFQKDFLSSKITGQQSLTAPKDAEIVPHGWSVHVAPFTGSCGGLTTLAQLIGAVTDSEYSYGLVLMTCCFACLKISPYPNDLTCNFFLNFAL